MYGRRRSGQQMENQQQQASAPSACRGGCGFFGASSTDGYCSQCYKEAVQKQQDAVRLSSPVISTSMVASSSSILPESAETCAKAAINASELTAYLESEEAANLTRTNVDALTERMKEIEAPLLMSDIPPAPKKANRCGMCKKRVGLTGFTCRCGGLYCGDHRYDQAHNCDFDYKTLERETIRKNNPVVVSDKVQRI